MLESVSLGGTFITFVYLREGGRNEFIILFIEHAVVNIGLAQESDGGRVACMSTPGSVELAPAGVGACKGQHGTGTHQEEVAPAQTPP